MYKSPIELYMTDITRQVIKQQEEQILKAVQSVAVGVDRDELLRALRFDRGQYEKGYRDAIAEKNLVEVVRCKDCKHYDNTEGIQWCSLNSKFAQLGTDWHSFPEDGFCSYGERK